MNTRLLSIAGALWTAAAFGAAPEWVTRAAKTPVPPDLLSTRPAPESVVLWDQQIVTAAPSSGSTKLFRRQAVKILTVGGGAAGTFEASYDDDSRVDIEGAWSAHGDGTAEELKLRDVVSTQLANPEYFTDTRVLFFRPPRLAPGDVAAFALSRKSRRDVYQWILPVQEAQPVLGREFVVDLPDGWRHRWRLNRAPDGYAGPLFGEGGNKASYPFGPQRALPQELSAPPTPDLPARMEIALVPPTGSFGDLAFSTWNDVARWFEKKSVPARGELPPGLRVVQSNALADASRWVQEKIRYVALEVGEGGYVARPPALVAQRRFGDCKDKAFLLIALLKANGIEAYPVLAQAREHGRVDPEFPSPAQFNHLIVAVRPARTETLASQVSLSDGPLVIFDPTDPWTPYGQLSEGLQGSRALIVKQGTGLLVELPYAPEAINRHRRTVDAILDSEGRLRASVRDVTEGSECQRGAYQSMSALERSETVGKHSDRAIPGSRVEDLSFEHLDEPNLPLESRYSVTAPDYLRRAGGVLLLPVLPFAMGPSRISRLSERRFPIELGVPRQIEVTATVRLPDAFRVDALPDAVAADNAYATYHFSVRREDKTLIARESYRVKKPSIPVADIDAWRQIESAATHARGATAALLPN